MKRLLAWLLCAVMLLSLCTACGDPLPAEDATTTTTTEETTTTTEETITTTAETTATTEEPTTTTEKFTTQTEEIFVSTKTTTVSSRVTTTKKPTTSQKPTTKKTKATTKKRKTTSNTTKPPTTYPVPNGDYCDPDKHVIDQRVIPPTCIKDGCVVADCRKCSCHYVIERIERKGIEHQVEKGSDTCSLCNRVLVAEKIKLWLVSGNGKLESEENRYIYYLGPTKTTWSTWQYNSYLVYDLNDDILYFVSTDLNDETMISYLVLSGENVQYVRSIKKNTWTCEGVSRFREKGHLYGELECADASNDKDKEQAEKYCGSFIFEASDKIVDFLKETSQNVPFEEIEFFKYQQK